VKIKILNLNSMNFQARQIKRWQLRLLQTHIKPTLITLLEPIASLFKPGNKKGSLSLKSLNTLKSLGKFVIYALNHTLNNLPKIRTFKPFHARTLNYRLMGHQPLLTVKKLPFCRGTIMNYL
jgi:hypothetical protein